MPAFKDDWSKYKEWSTAALLARALALSRNDCESEERWACVHQIRSRSELEMFEIAKRWCGSEHFVERELAADILAQFGAQTREGKERLRPFTRETIPLLETLLNDSEPRVIASAISALGHHDAHHSILNKVSLSSHPCARVRFAVACALGGATSPAAITTLIKLSADPDADTRNWATFGLGTQCDLDTPEIREALIRRLTDGDFDTKSEALIGLAERKDSVVLPALKAALMSDNVGTLAVEAARALASPDLLEALLELRSWWDVEAELLEEAIEACQAVPTTG